MIGSSPTPTTESENEIVALRRRRVQALQQAGRDPYSETRFERSHLSGDLIANFEALDGQTVRIAGRLKSKRGQGKISFADLWDSSGKIQVLARLDRLGEAGMADFA